MPVSTEQLQGAKGRNGAAFRAERTPAGGVEIRSRSRYGIVPEAPSPIQLLTGVVQEVQLHTPMKGVRGAIDSLIHDTPEHRALQPLRNHHQQVVERDPLLRAEAPSTASPTDPDQYLHGLVGRVSGEVQRTMTHDDVRSKTAVDRVYGMHGSPFLQELKHVVELAVDRAEQGSTPEAALREAAIIAQRENNHADRSVHPRNRVSAPGTIRHPHLEAKATAGKIDPEEHSKIIERHKADTRSHQPVTEESIQSAFNDLPHMMRQSYDDGYITRDTWVREMKAAYEDGDISQEAWVRGTFAAMVEEGKEVVVRTVNDKKEHGQKPKDQNFVTVLRRTPMPLGDLRGSTVIELEPNVPNQPGAEFALLTTSDDLTQARREMNDVFGRLDENGVALVDTLAPLADEIFENNDGNSSLTVIDVVRFGPRTGVLVQAHPTHLTQAVA
jgi:hypothetical protein